MKLPSLNRVQLLGRVYEPPKLFDEGAVTFARLLVEVDEHDPGEKFFSSYHVVVIQKDKIADGVGPGDVVYVEGRLNPYVVHLEGKADRTGVNVQGSAVFVMRRNQEHLRDVLGGEEVAEEPLFVEADAGTSENVVALFGTTDVDEEPPF